MDRVISIIISLIVGLLVYIGFVLVLRTEKNINYISKRWYYHPNAICAWRVVMAIIGAMFYFILGKHFMGILLFTVSAILDGVDGLVARKCDMITKTGKEIDPLCDKLTYIPPMFFFAGLGILEFTPVWIFTAIEFCGQFFIRSFIKRFTKFSVAANNFGKIKAVLCFALIIYCAILDGAITIPDFTTQIIYGCIILSIASSAFKLITNRLYADILSILNLMCGITGIVFVFQGHYVYAVIAILAGQIFDLFDGRMAEKHGGTKFGPWLDDIADLISFGMCPGILIIVQGNLRLFPIILGIFYFSTVGFRLWRYLMIDKHDETLPIGVFNGLPSPAGVMVTLGACLFWQNSWIAYVVVILTSFIMVSHVRFVHFGRVILKKLPRAIIVLFGFAVVFIISYLIKARNPETLGAILLICSLLYMALGNNRIMNRIK